jgi:CHAT domain-containing protein
MMTPLANALLPADPWGVGPVTTYILHGPLQGAPVAALPLPARNSVSGTRSATWLGQITAVAVQPAAASLFSPPEVAVQPAAVSLASPPEMAMQPATVSLASPPGAKLHGVTRDVEVRPGASQVHSLDPGPDELPIFVIDPQGDLAGASALVPFYARLFPHARILQGRAATVAELRRSLDEAVWLHLDTHGLYEAGFPELSALVLADRPISLMELADLPVPRLFANLSACHSGTWPTTSDSGRYGIAGQLVRRGVPWAIASITELDDAVAQDFNRSFYKLLSAGSSVADAYRGALTNLAERRSPSAWAPLLLLKGAGPGATAGNEARSRLLLSRDTSNSVGSKGVGR